MATDNKDEEPCQLDSRVSHPQTDPALNLNSSRAYKCVCELCSCGIHRAKQANTDVPDLTSKETFKHPIPANTNQYINKQQFPLQMPTNTKRDITTLKPSKQGIKKPLYLQIPTTTKNSLPQDSKTLEQPLSSTQRSILRPHVPFIGSSSYKDQFKSFDLKHPTNPQDPYLNVREKIPDYGFTSPAKFEGKSAYKESFSAPTPPKINNYPHPQYRKPEVPFYGSSSYKQEFKQFNLPEQRFQAYSQSLYSAPKVKFQGKSTYRDYYQDYKLEPSREQNPGGSRCVLQGMDYPQRNFIESSSPHVYYDQSRKRFI